jgi:hypothetical protein
MLPGYGRCDGQGEPAWLSTKSLVTLDPGQSINMPVTLDSAKVTQPGSYTATLWARAHGPYKTQMLPVEMKVRPPTGWTPVHGMVTDTDGDAIVGATVVQIDTNCGTPGKCGSVSHTVRTDLTGYYQWWVAPGENPLQVTAAKDGYLQRLTMTTATGGASAQDAGLDFALAWHGFV